MSRPPLFDAPQSPFTAYDLQPLLSTLASLALVAIIVSLVASLVTDSDQWLTWPVHALDRVQGMVAVGISALLGRTSLGNVEWGKASESPSRGGDSKRVVRRYKETAEGKKKAAGGGQHFPGLLNAAGNLCFLNATLQSMASLPALLSYLDELAASAEDVEVETPVALSLVNTLEALNTPSSSRPAPLRPIELANALVASSPTRRRLLANSDQQDAHELWVMMRDAVEEEAVKVAATQERLASRESGLKEVAKLQAGLGLAVGTKVKRTAATDPFFWLRSQRVRCMECGYVRDTRHEGEELLMLSVPPISHCSLHDLLTEYTKTDLVSAYNCRRCALLATLSKYEAQRDRLALQPEPNTTPTPNASTPGAVTKRGESRSRAANPFELPPEPALSTAAPTKMTASRKDRRRKVQKLVDRIKDAADAGDWERELGEGIKVERSEVAAGKMTRFARPPEVLAIHLNRSSHYSYAGGVKNSCQVTFPEYLNISPFCDGPTTKLPEAGPGDGTAPVSTPDLYRVASLVVHYGSHSFGHYVAFRRRPPLPEDVAVDVVLPEWYRISDETVQPATVDEALRANPYLLFYERVDMTGNPITASSPSKKGIENVTQVLTDGAKARIVESWRANGTHASRETSATPVDSDSPP